MEQINPFVEAAKTSKEIPLLTARDVELRVGSLDKDGKWVTLLVYKDARIDMRILDEVYGPTNWKREHAVIDGQLFCTVSIWDNAKGMWISKQDVGKESKTEAEKGRASDSFKRACFNVGIGRELYDAPFIYIKLNPSETAKNGKGMIYLKTKFRVKKMTYNKALGEFSEFVVVDQHGKVRYNQSQHDEEEEEKENGDSGDSGKNPPMLYVAKDAKTGVTIIRGRKNLNTWFPLACMTIEQLNDVVNEPLYKACHQEAFNLMAEKSKTNA